MITNLADAMVVIKEQQKEIKRLREWLSGRKPLLEE